jgi:MFS family permease
VFFMAQFLQSGLHYGPLAAGVRLIPWGATVVVIPQVVGRLIGRFRERPFMVAGLTLNGLALIWIALIAKPNLAYRQLAIPLVLSGAGVATSIPAAQSAVLTSVAPKDIGRASGAFSTMRQLGGAFGVAVLVAVFAAAGSYVSAHGFTNGFTAAIAAAAGLSFAGAWSGSPCLAVKRRANLEARPIARHHSRRPRPPDRYEEER